jgi:hypothetical protein
VLSFRRTDGTKHRAKRAVFPVIVRMNETNFRADQKIPKNKSKKIKKIKKKY